MTTDPRFVDVSDPATLSDLEYRFGKGLFDFGAHDADSEKGTVVTLSMSTADLEPGLYSRYILWRRGYKAADGTIKGVGLVADAYAADAFAVVDYVTVTQKITTADILPTGLQNVKVITATAFANNNSIVVNSKKDGSCSVYDIVGRCVANNIQLQKGQTVIATTAKGVNLLSIKYNDGSSETVEVINP